MPLAIAEAAAEIARSAEDVAAHARVELRPDALIAAALAEAGAASAALLVEVNRGLAEDDRRRVRGRALASDAARSRRDAWRRYAPGTAFGSIDPSVT